MSNLYYYYKNGEKIGPISEAALKAMAQQGLITRETLIEKPAVGIIVAGEVNGLTFSDSPRPTVPSSSSVAAALPAKSSTDINSKDRDGKTRLHHAALNNDTNAIATFIKAGANVDAKNNDGETPLHLGVASKAIKATAILIQSGANINAKCNDGATPLHIAAALNVAEAVVMLVKAGANVNSKANEGMTPLHGAVMCDAADIVTMLIKAGADVNLQDLSGRTPLMFAKERNAGQAALALQVTSPLQEKGSLDQYDDFFVDFDNLSI